MLDAAGLTDCKIVASNSLDEYVIRDLIAQGARIDAFGVGERMIVSKSEPVFGGVYKLAAVEEEDGTIVPRIKVSENIEKITNPHFKKLYRIFDKATGNAMADLICVHDEVIDTEGPLTIFDPVHTWKRKTYTDYILKPLQAPVYQNGKLVYERPTVPQIRAYCADCVAHLWDEVKRFENPHHYYVDLSEKLWNIKQSLLRGSGKDNT